MREVAFPPGALVLSMGHRLSRTSQCHHNDLALAQAVLDDHACGLNTYTEYRRFGAVSVTGRADRVMRQARTRVVPVAWRMATVTGCSPVGGDVQTMAVNALAAGFLMKVMDRAWGIVSRGRRQRVGRRVGLGIKVGPAVCRTNQRFTFSTATDELCKAPLKPAIYQFNHHCQYGDGMASDDQERCRGHHWSFLESFPAHPGRAEGTTTICTHVEMS